MLEENRYAVTLALAGFSEADLDIVVKKGVLTVRGEKPNGQEEKTLHQGVAARAFERKFNLDDHVEVVGANLVNGLLTISRTKVFPEAIQIKPIAINNRNEALAHPASDDAGENTA